VSTAFHVPLQLISVVTEMVTKEWWKLAK